MLAILGSTILPSQDLKSLPSTRERLSLNSNWKFHKGDPDMGGTVIQYDDFNKVQGKTVTLKPYILPSGNRFLSDPTKRHTLPYDDPSSQIHFAQTNFNDNDWQSVTLPHDWAIEGPFLQKGNYGGMGRLKTWGAVWYRRDLSLTQQDKGKSIFLDIDGAMSYSSVWLNGKLVGGWPYGYASFRLDLTPFANIGGKNELAIRLDNPPDSARWYPGAGLYRNVWLTKTAPTHISQWGTRVTTPKVSPESAEINLEIEVDNDSDKEEIVSTQTRIYANEGGSPVGNTSNSVVVLKPKSSGKTNHIIIIPDPKLWGPPPQQRPNLYTAVTTVTRNGKQVDESRTQVGIRTITYDANQGVLVNGQKIPLNGVNNHHDLGSLGSAFNERAAERQLQMLQEMGCNSIRMSHNPPAPELLDLADRMGFLVLDEIFDCWNMKKNEFDFHLIFPDWHEPDLRAFMRRDRNHPSIIVWSVGNEVGEQFIGEDGAKVSRELVGIAHEEDSTRPVMTAMNWSKSEMPLPTTVDIITLNYQGIGVRAFPGQFRAFHEKFPNKVILSSESAAALSTRGEYQFPVPGVQSAAVRPGVGGNPKTNQVSAYELFAADFGTSADKVFTENDLNPYVAGEFVWTGWDYLGEPTPYYDARSSYFGIIDLAGFKKDRFYLYQSRWRPDLPMAHILPHWTWPDRVGEVTPIHVFTSGDEAELFINGKSQGRKKKAPYEYRFRWDYTTYEPGEVSVVTYKNGKEWARDSVRTADAPAKLEAIADRSTIHADGKDLSFITVKILDAKGTVCPASSNRITFSIEGPGEIVSTDNGDPTSFESFQSPSKSAFNGHCLAVVRSKAKGSFKVTARSGGLESAAVVVKGE